MIIRSSKLKEETTVEEKDGAITLTKAVNIDSVLKNNYELRKDPQNGFSKDRSWRRVMSVPMETLMEWKREFPEIMSGDRIAEDRALQKLMKREENKVFSTVENVRGIF